MKEKPIIFSDGTKVFSSLSKGSILHKQGFFILAPSGTGKTHFVKGQKKKHWQDGDAIWNATGAHPKRAWWTESLESINEVDLRSDVITIEAKKLGLWILGASNIWLAPDAVVLPEWETNKKYIIMRERTNYDGGAKSSDFKQVIGHRRVIRQHARKHKVPVFKSITEATNYLENLYSKKFKK